MSDDEFRTLARDSVSQFSRRPPDQAVLDGLLERLFYVAVPFTERDRYDVLKERLDGLDTDFEQHANRAYYLSTAPEFFPVIVQMLGDAGLHKHAGHRRAGDNREAVRDRPRQRA